MTHMLIADLHAVFLRSLEQLVRSSFPDVHVVAVDNWEILMGKLNEQSWDLVLCDIRLYFAKGKNLFNDMHGTQLFIMGMLPNENVAEKIAGTGAAGYFMKDTMHEDIFTLLTTKLAFKK